MNTDFKTLKQSGVPFGARLLFRLRYLPVVLFAFMLLLTIPVLALAHVMGSSVLEDVTEFLNQKHEEMKAKHQRIIDLYKGRTNGHVPS